MTFWRAVRKRWFWDSWVKEYRSQWKWWWYYFDAYCHYNPVRWYRRRKEWEGLRFRVPSLNPMRSAPRLGPGKINT